MENKIEIKCENISKVYGNDKDGNSKVIALQNVNFSIKKGEFVFILGPSGAGKSTLLNILGGMDSATDGKYYLSDKDVTAMKYKELSNFRRTDIGFVFQFYNLVPTLTAYENVYLATSELNRIAISGLELNDELIAKLVSSLNAISFDTLFNTLLKSHDASAKIAQYFDANSIEESVFLAALYKSFYRLFLIHSGLKLKPNAKLQEFLGYAPPPHLEAELKAQASRFSLPMFYDIFAHLNACDYELKKPKNFMDKELFLRSELLKLSSIIAKHSKH